MWSLNMCAKGCVALLVLVLLPGPLWAGVACDGVDDDLPTGLVFTDFITSTAGTISLWYTPTGAADSDNVNCGGGGRIWVAYEENQGNWIALMRHNNFGGLDRITNTHWDGTADCNDTTYTVNVPMHLAWVHSAGTTSLLYKDGVQVDTVASGTTADLTANILLYFCAGSLVALDGVNVAEGTITNLQTFPAALTAEQVANLASRTHRISAGGVPSGDWPLDECAHGASGQGVTFRDRSGNNRHLVGDDGPNNTGATCQGETVVSYPWGPE